MAAVDDLAKIVPKPVLDLIRDRIKAGVTDAEAKFRLNEADEDAITGALGHAISTPAPVLVTTPEGAFSYEITSIKIRGRGLNAPEKRLGADSIFQVSVTKGNTRIFAKGLPFQAKKGGGFGNAKVIKQAIDLYRTSKTGTVVRYSRKGYTAVDVREMVSRHTGPNLPAKPAPKKLATVFGDDFVDCTIGRLGLYYAGEMDLNQGENLWTITTTIRSER